MKRITTIVLSVMLLLLSSNTIAFAESVSDTTFVATERAFCTLFNVDNCSFTADYSYEIIKKKGQNEEATLLTSLHIGEYDYSFRSENTDDVLSLYAGTRTFSLEGSVTINGHEYIVYSKLTENMQTSEIQVDQTIQDYPDTDPTIDPVCYSFGKSILKRYMFTNQIDSSCIEDDNKHSIEQPTRSFSYVTAQSKPFPSSTGIYGNCQSVRVYHEPSSKRVSVGIRSFTNNVKGYYLNQGNPAVVIAFVSNFSMRLKRTNNTNVHTSISGIESFNFVHYNTNGADLSLLFLEILEYFGVPTPTISAILDNAAGKVTVTHYTNDTKATISNLGASSSPNMDEPAVCGLPIIFQLVEASSGTDNYTAITTIKYDVIYIPDSAYPTNTYYYTVNGTSTNVSFNITY